MFPRRIFSTNASPLRQIYPLYQRPANHLNVKTFLSQFSEIKEGCKDSVTLTGKN